MCIYYILHILHILNFLHLCNGFLLFRESNIKKNLRAKPSSWYIVGWMKIIDDGKSCRPGQGYDRNAARNVRVHQECWRKILRPFIQNTNSRVVLFGDNKARQTPHGIGAELADQQVHIAYFTYFAHIFLYFAYLQHIAY